MNQLNFPFSAIIGQEQMTKALLFNVIDPKIGGVLLTGHQGTGKSTAVRSLADILPEIIVIENCPFLCDPNDEIENLCDSCNEKRLTYGNSIPILTRPISIINLPLGVTEDMVCGSLDLEKVLNDGIKSLNPGLIAKANRGLLYIDEINLLQDHIVDILLDAASSGVNVIEREGVSISHPADFILVGSMNPEEGELRPQINDRFGLEVIIEAPTNSAIRAEITKRVIEYNRDPLTFIENYETSQNFIKEKIREAKKFLNKVEIPHSIYEFISNLVISLNIQSHRADITFIRCARAAAAFRGSNLVELEDFDSAIDLVFRHRLNNVNGDFTPEEIFDNIKEVYDEIKEKFESINGMKPNRNQEGPLKINTDPQTEFKRMPFDPKNMKEIPESMEKEFPLNNKNQDWEREHSESNRAGFGNKEKKFTIEDLKPVAEHFQKRITEIMKIFKESKKVTDSAGRGRTKVTSSQKGRYISYKNPHKIPRNIAFDASIKRHLIRTRSGDTFLHQNDENSNNNLPDISGVLNKSTKPTKSIKSIKPIKFPIQMEHSDIMEKVFEFKAPLSIYFILDASGSMARYIKQMSEIIRSLHQEGYKKKDKMSIIVFRGKKAHILQRPTTNIGRILAKLPSIEGTSYTPLGEALHKCENIIKAERMKNKDIIPVVVICSDLGANVSRKSPDLRARSQEDFDLIADELKTTAKLFSRKKIRTIIIMPKKGRAIKNLGINPMAVDNIRDNFKNAGAEIFNFDPYQSHKAFIKLKKIL
ncbi:MAG: VWA domain-containing protein [archaeon]|nr:VWA domain-containing protein [archaeon]